MDIFYLIIKIVILIQIFRFFFLSGPKLSVKIIKDDPVNLAEGLQFEIENVGNRPTALYPIVTSSFLTPTGEKREMTFDVQGSSSQELILPVYGKKSFKATPRQVQPERINGNSIHYCFDHGKGASVEVVVN